jgi:hypothetical protein
MTKKKKIDSQSPSLKKVIDRSSPSLNKSGPWSKAEKHFIAEKCSTMTAQDIAATLRRNADVVSNYILENHASSFMETARSAEYDIKKSPVWSDLNKQFSKEELNMFLFHWGRIISQFRDDVYPTEEMQVIDTIKLEILMNRCLSQQQKCMAQIKDLEILLVAERSEEVKNVVEIGNMERQIGILRAAQESLNSDFKDMLKRKNDLLSGMKATREARIRHLESNKNNFLSVIRRIVEDKPFRTRLGLDMEKFRMASIVEYKRLSEYYAYEDGQVDRPLLTPETTLFDEEEE